MFYPEKKIKHTSRDAKREASPIGMNTIVTSMNAEITCSMNHIKN